MPSAQSVPVASAISASRASAPAARSGLPACGGRLDELGSSQIGVPSPRGCSAPRSAAASASS